LIGVQRQGPLVGVVLPGRGLRDALYGPARGLPCLPPRCYSEVGGSIPDTFEAARRPSGGGIQTARRKRTPTSTRRECGVHVAGLHV